MENTPENIQEKHTHRGEEQKKSLLNRLRRIEGQIRGLEQMVENDAYCNDILQQSAAARSALDGFNQEMLSNHIHGCVTKGIQEGDQQIVDELVKTIRKLMK
jgi:DNA-binding FrmR family transcriptional regulator